MDYLLAILMLLSALNFYTCYESKRFEDSIVYKIEWAGGLSKLTDLSRYELLDVTTQDKEKYRCAIPVASSKEEGREDIDTNISPLNFITPIFSLSSCSYRIEAYWAYEICHGHHVKQYHEEREGKSIKVQEYYLGKWDSSKTEILEEKMVQEQKARRRLQYTKIDNVKYPYVELEMSDGTLCDINNEPRITRVRYVCYPHGKNEIYSLKETSTCNYEAIVLTSVLCMHSAYLPEDSDENSIVCFSVGKSPDHPYSWLLNEIENMKIHHTQISALFSPKEKNPMKADPKDILVPSDFAKNNIGISPLSNNVDETADSMLNFKNANSEPSNLKDTSPVNDFLGGKNCLTGGTGWWKYEFCYGRQVRQFHSDINGEISIILGFYDEELHKAWLKVNPEKRPKPKHLRTDISHLYQGGTICDKTGEKRQTEVKLKCMDNFSSLATVSMYLLEPKTCQYILVIESPLICDILKMADDNGLISKERLEKSSDGRYEND